MKITITFKNSFAVQEALLEDCHHENEKIEELVNKFVKKDGFLTIELDTVAGTARVVPVK